MDPPRLPVLGLRHYKMKPANWVQPSGSHTISNATLSDGWSFQPDPAVFFTPWHCRDPSVVQERLALTYEPRVVYAWDPPEWGWVWENPAFEFHLPFEDSARPSRIWPAFGKGGGAHEIIMTKGSLPCRRIGFVGGFGTDDYYQDRPATSDLTEILNALARDACRGVYSGIGTAAGRVLPELIERMRREEEMRIFIKTSGSQGVSLTLPLTFDEGIRNRFVTVSFGYKELEEGGMSVRVWAELWRDDQWRARNWPKRYRWTIAPDDLALDAEEIEGLDEDDIGKIRGKVRDVVDRLITQKIDLRVGQADEDFYLPPPYLPSDRNPEPEE